MGDNGFHEFFNPDTGPFSVFNPNASSRKEVATQARSVTEAAKDGASELCERCKGSGLVTLHDTYMGDADDQTCPDCTGRETETTYVAARDNAGQCPAGKPAAAALPMIQCPECKGEGLAPNEWTKCIRCDGNASIEDPSQFSSETGESHGS